MMLRNLIESYVGHGTDMLRVAVCLVFAILGISAQQITQPIFTFKSLSSIFRQNSDDCKICYGNHDCQTFDRARCEYYTEVEDILQKPVDDEDVVNPALKESVDAMLFDLVEKAIPLNKECIPYISEYTDCSKENICTGCKRCSCDAQGEWNCTMVQQCRADNVLNVDHGVLVAVLRSLNSMELSYRMKRAVTEQPDDPKTVLYDEISEWLYDFKPIRYDKLNTKPEENIKEESFTNVNEVSEMKRSYVDTVYNTTSNVSEHQPDTDYLAFDEVLNNIEANSKNYSRRKPPLDAQTDMDYMIMEDINITYNTNASDQFLNTLNVIEGIESITEAPIEGVTKVVIDLLESVKKYRFKYNETDYMIVDDKVKSKFERPFDNLNNIDELNAVNIMKREISNASDITEISITENNYLTESGNELKDNVLQPLSDIITEKQKELQNLLNVKENLIRVMKSFNSGEIELNLKDNRTENSSNTYFSIYKMEIIPQFDYDLRTNNPDILDKYLYKLKRDIYEVIKDIVAIKKTSDDVNIPEELKVLMRAMKFYIRKGKKSKTEFKNPNILRQNYTDIFNYNPKSIKDCVIEIFELLDNGMSEANALSPLSQTAKRLLMRIIKNNYVDEFAVIELRANDPNYNFTNELDTIGNNWQKVTQKVVDSSVHDQLYAKKLLYLTLSADMSKIMDAIKLIKFAHSRRSVDPSFGTEFIKKIHDGLQVTSNKMNFLLKHIQNESKHKSKDFVKTKEPNENVRESFFKQLRRLLGSSKSDVEDLLKKNVPKSEIVREIAKKKLSSLTKRRLSKYEDIMKRWQFNLDIVPKRYKRSPRDVNRIKNRIKNIIPKYLRGKINPAMVAKNSKKVTKKGKIKKSTVKIAAITTTMKSKIKSNTQTNEKIKQ